ncbi:hypothetical protein B484DRAFT_67501 [Ochromonadaceae sp. CCMP2298]|nr:hypothetical protein B484DRAFT_67501 [Ochromonadaceae sp. CCMP2298]
MEMLLASAALGLLGLGTLPFAHAATNSYHQIRSNENQPLNSYFKVPPSVRQWDTLETPGAFTILSMAVDTHDRSPWYIQALHRRYSAGWNRTHEAAFSNRPHACVVRFLGVGREETVLEGFQTGGTGYMELSFKNERGKEQYLGFDKNETNRVHCYYRTQKDQGSEFLDTPKTLALAIVCPVPLDMEVGEFHFKAQMQQGLFCRPLAEVSTNVIVHLRPSNFLMGSPAERERQAQSVEKNEAVGEVVTQPFEVRGMRVRAGGHGHGGEGGQGGQGQEGARPHAVCTVQTFRNAQTGAMLYMFIAWYQKMGWRVIVYDRYYLYTYIYTCTHTYILKCIFVSR